MSARDIIRNGLCQSDLDGGNHKLVNFDTSNLQFGQFGTAAPHSILAGPTSGIDAVPTVRDVVNSDLVAWGAQPHTAGLDLLAPLTPTTSGLGLITLTNSVAAGYIKNTGQDTLNTWTYLTPTQLRTDIAAQPLHASLTALTGITPTTVGLNFVALANPGFAGYAKIASNNTLSVLTPAQVAADIGASIAPFVDTTSLVKGSSDATKLFRVEVDGFTTGTTRVMTPPNYNFTPASLTGAEPLTNKDINGLTLAVGTAANADIAPTYGQTPIQPFQLSLVALAPASSATLVFRCAAPCDLVVPATGTLATVQTTIPLSYLSTKTDLNDGGGPSNTKVSSQLAVYTFVTEQIASIPSIPSTGYTPDIFVAANGSTQLVTDRAFGQWYQLINCGAGLGAYTHVLRIFSKNASAGSIYRIRLELPASDNPTIEIRDDDSNALLDTVVGWADAPRNYALEAVFYGLNWKKYEAHEVLI